MLTERQQFLLEKIVAEYVERAEPVSSQLLEKSYNLGVGPATIRRDFAHLTDEGYLMQPHTSAGRVPTDKGYRFVVNKLLQNTKKAAKPDKKVAAELQSVKKKREDALHMMHEITRLMAETSHLFALARLHREVISVKEGWEHVVSEPEFQDPEYIQDFAQLLDNLEEHITDIDDTDITVYIGSENTLSHAKNFSIVAVSGRFPGAARGVVALVGPKRMRYSSNLRMFHALQEFMQR